MPELIWKGKEQVVNHHQDVPVRTLDREYTYNSDKESDNKIIHGDNLEALKALLPQYEGRVKCIYIDPPYNTGNESWVYNDNVKDPRIVKWLGEVVGKEGEDLCRHDKWLCMMYPRLQLLKRLLADDGVIFISIDDNEQPHLRAMMGEIFGNNNFRSCITWQRKYSVSNNFKGIATIVDYILVYSKSFNFKNNLLPRTQESIKRYKNPDNDPRGPWKSVDYLNQVSPEQRPNLCYDIINPNSGLVIKNIQKAWKYEYNVYKQHIAENKLWWGNQGENTVPSLKLFLSEVRQGMTPHNWWPHEDTGHTDAAKKEINNIIGSNVFDTPKPTKLMDRILHIATDKDSIILDSFAGSGTTAHAILNLNKKDGGNRKFILIEMMDYAETITAERVRRVIDGYGEGKKAVEGTDGDFSYYTLGEKVFDDSGNLNESLGITKIRDYVAWTERLPGAENGDNRYWLGEKNRTDYYFYYEPDQLTALNLDFLATLTSKSEAYLVYADICLLDELFMAEKHIRFKKIPRDISRF